MKWGLAETPQHGVLPLAARGLASSNQNRPHRQLEKLFITRWCQVAMGAVAIGRCSQNWRPPQLQLAVCQGQKGPWCTPDTPQDWACFAAVLGHSVQQRLLAIVYLTVLPAATSAK